MFQRPAEIDATNPPKPKSASQSAASPDISERARPAAGSLDDVRMTRYRCLACGYPLQSETQLRCAECGRAHTTGELADRDPLLEAARLEQLAWVLRAGVLLRAPLLLAALQIAREPVMPALWTIGTLAGFWGGWIVARGRVPTTAGRYAIAAMHCAALAFVVAAYFLLRGDALFPGAHSSVLLAFDTLAAAAIVAGACHPSVRLHPSANAGFRAGLVAAISFPAIQILVVTRIGIQARRAITGAFSTSWTWEWDFAVFFLLSMLIWLSASWHVTRYASAVRKETQG